MCKLFAIINKIFNYVRSGDSAAEETKYDKIVAASFFNTLDKNRDRVRKIFRLLKIHSN